MVICLERVADLHMAQLMPLPLTVSCFSKIHIDLTFLVPAHPGSPGQGTRVDACLCVLLTQAVSLTDDQQPAAEAAAGLELDSELQQDDDDTSDVVSRLLQRPRPSHAVDRSSVESCDGIIVSDGVQAGVVGHSDGSSVGDLSAAGAIVNHAMPTAGDDDDDDGGEVVADSDRCRAAAAAAAFTGYSGEVLDESGESTQHAVADAVRLAVSSTESSPVTGSPSVDAVARDRATSEAGAVDTLPSTDTFPADDGLGSSEWSQWPAGASQVAGQTVDDGDAASAAAAAVDSSVAEFSSLLNPLVSQLKSVVTSALAGRTLYISS